MSEILTASVFASMIRLAAPYLFAALGEMFGQRSGVLNLGVDGIMLMGAFGSFYVVLTAQTAHVDVTLSLILGVLVGLLIGALLGLVTAFISVTLQAEQGISGIGMYLFGLGMSELLFQKLIGTPKSISGFPPISIPILSDLPIVGEIFFRHNILVYLAFALVPISAYILRSTSWGLKIRAVGQNPAAADAMGVSVAQVRYATVTLGGTLAGLAGASLSIALLNVFQQNLTSGLGFIAVALVYFGRWQPWGVMLGAVLFSFVQALQLQISAIGIDVPAEFAAMSPYVITILALVFASKQSEKPTALTKPFMRGES